MGVLPGLTFQHLDSHFHRGLRMAQAMSSGLHHLPKGPRAKGTSWGRDGPSAPGPPGICLPPSLGSAYISLHPHPGLKVFPPMRLLKSRPSLVSHLSAVCFLNHLSPWKPCSLPRGEHSSSAPLGFPARLSIGLALSLSSVKMSFLVTKGSHLTEYWDHRTSIDGSWGVILSPHYREGKTRALSLTAGHGKAGTRPQITLPLPEAHTPPR